MVSYFDRIFQRELNPEVWEWLISVAEELQINNNKSAFVKAFTAMPRHTGKARLSLIEEGISDYNLVQPEISLQNYTIDRLARVWLLMKLPAEDKKEYIATISQLFKAAEMNELVALYGSLPFFAYPEEWVKHCVEGIRSNIGFVLEAIMCDNPFPARYLDESAWNQLVLKAFFTEKPVNRIIGLDERANQLLALILSDYAHERWAAGRTVDPQLWRLTKGFINDRIFPDLKKVFEGGSPVEKAAVALACYQSDYLPAKSLLDQDAELKSAIQSNKVNWNQLSYKVPAS